MLSAPEHLFIGGLTGLGPMSLPPDESRHCLQVLRLRAGKVVGVINGEGLLGVGPLLPPAGTQAQVNIETLVHDWGEPPVPTGLLLALPKDRDRLEWLLEKAVELGLTHLCLMHTQRTERSTVNGERLQRIARAALKQCRRSRLPQLQGPVLMEEALAWVRRLYPGALRVLAQADAPQPWAPPVPPDPRPTWLAVGPEGDFTPQEVALAQAQGWHLVHLGPTRLRTETAALHLLSLRKGAYGY